MNDDQFFLANAYLDGELTADERALAESDPVVMSEVEQLRALQTTIRDVEPPTAAARQAAIAAAMAEFAPAAATPPPEPAPRTVPFRPRPAYSRYLAVAAAVVAVGLLGVVVVNGIGGGGDDDAGDDAAIEIAGDAAADDSAEPESDDALAGRDMTEQAPAADAGDMAEEGTFDDTGDDAADDAGDDSGGAADSATADADMADSELDDDRAATGTAPTAEELASGVVAIVPAEGDLDRSTLPAPEALVEVATELLSLRDEGRLGSTPNTNCDFTDADDPAEILARHEFDIDDAATELLVATDEVNGIAYGIDPDTCFIVVVGPLP